MRPTHFEGGAALSSLCPLTGFFGADAEAPFDDVLFFRFDFFFDMIGYVTGRIEDKSITLKRDAQA